MRKLMRWIATIVGGLLLLAVLLYGVASLRGPTDEQRKALALLEDPGPPAGRNGFALIWLLAYDMPDTEREHVLAQDVRRFAQRLSTKDITADFTSSAEGRYPKAKRRSAGSEYCRWREGNCLVKVRENPEAYVRLIAEDAAILARAGTLSVYGHVRNPFPPGLDMPLPAYHQLAYPLTQHAHAFVSGDTDRALAGACRDAATARMMIGKGGDLISSMIGAAMLEGNSALLADMLAELPTDHALPASCSRAFAQAAPEEFSACTAMRGEARFMFTGMRRMPAEYATEAPLQRALWPLLFDAEKTVARMAPSLSWYCSPPALASVAQDKPVPAPPAPPPIAQAPLECLDNIAGCILSDVGTADLSMYQHRLQDARLRMMVMSTLLRIRDQPANVSMAERLARAPLCRTCRTLTLANDGKSVSIPLFDTQRAQNWIVPLPASRLVTAGLNSKAEQHN